MDSLREFAKGLGLEHFFLLQLLGEAYHLPEYPNKI